jgi:hypothetical protein
MSSKRIGILKKNLTLFENIFKIIRVPKKSLAFSKKNPRGNCRIATIAPDQSSKSLCKATPRNGV